MTTFLRIATFNLENLDDRPNQSPDLDTRIRVLRPQLLRLRADILCLQEVNGQEQAGDPRRLLALERLLAGTPYAAFHRVSTHTASGDDVYDERNLVILSRFPFAAHRQLRHDIASAPLYRKVTADPAETEARAVTWERPILYAALNLPQGRCLHLLNLHLKSRLPSYIDGQKLDRFTWKSDSAWAEGFFLSSMKRVGQALEARLFIDTLFDVEPEALVAVCGDFNADVEEVPVEAIRGDVENTGNPGLADRVLVPCERTVARSARYSLFHRGQGKMIDHILISRSLMGWYTGAEIHNELLHDESVQGGHDKLFPESDHAPVVAAFIQP